MIRGRVDERGRALISIAIRSAPDADPETIDAWIDTGFTGELVVPQSVVQRLGLTESSGITAVLADGSEHTLSTYQCTVNWFGVQRPIEAVMNDGESPLLGVGLLIGHRLLIDYQILTLSIE